MLPLGAWAAFVVAAPRFVGVELPPSQPGVVWDHLLLGLVEEGYGLTAANESHTVLTAWTSTAAIVLSVRGERNERFSLDRTGRAVVSIDVLHRALGLLAGAGKVPRSMGELHLVALSIDDPDERLSGWLEQLSRPLLRPGFAWVSGRERHAAAVCVRASGDSVEMVIAVRADACLRPSPGVPIALDTIALELGEALDQFFEARPASPRAVLAPDARTEPLADASGPTRLLMGVDGGALFSDSAVDLGLRIHASGRLPSGLGLSASLMGVPSTPDGGASGDLLDMFFCFGPSYQAGLVGALDGVVSLSGGLHWQHYSITAGDSGDRIDLAAMVEGALIYPMAESLAVRLGGVMGVRSTRRTHRVDGVDIWSRSIWLTGLVAGISYQLSI